MFNRDHLAHNNNNLPQNGPGARPTSSRTFISFKGFIILQVNSPLIEKSMISEVYLFIFGSLRMKTSFEFNFCSPVN